MKRFVHQVEKEVSETDVLEKLMKSGGLAIELPSELGSKIERALDKLCSLIEVRGTYYPSVWVHTQWERETLGKSEARLYYCVEPDIFIIDSKTEGYGKGMQVFTTHKDVESAITAFNGIMMTSWIDRLKRIIRESESNIKWLEEEMLRKEEVLEKVRKAKEEHWRKVIR